MPGINNNLYPPIFKKSYVPAFVGKCRIYFSISIYNSLTNINQNAVQVIVQNQKTNQSVLKHSLYPSGIKITSLGIDNEIQNDEKYYIEIGDSDIEGKFNFNEYYKVQIRFSQSDVETPSNSIGIDNWLNNNLIKFSQWSTVVLIKPISEPILSLKNFNLNATSTTITNSDLTILGIVQPSLTGDKEGFKSYRIFIYDENNVLLEDSKNKYFQDSNEIQYNCKYNFESGNSYILKIQILTENLYFMQKSINFQVNYATYEDFEATIVAEIDKNAACAIVTLNNNILAELGTNIVIRRTSSKNNFTFWEDVYTTLIPPNSKLDLIWKDFTIESGVWYKYSVVKRNKQNFRSVPIEIEKPIMGIFEDIFLTTSTHQLKIRFDPQINNYSRVVSESLTETIGSKYPFIRRNGKVNYRTFAISGTISYFCDLQQNLMHSAHEDLYGEDSKNLYEQYNINNNINLYNDIIQEKEFREKVIDFLYDNNAKLYKSATQGNIIVKLMNITLTPNNTLSRQIYSFNCTAYEIDEFNYQNCVKYNIQNEGVYVNQTNFFILKLGQVIVPSLEVYYKNTNDKIKSKKTSYFGSQDILSGLLKTKYEYLEMEDMGINVNHLSYLKISLTSEPYLIGLLNGRPYQIKNQNENINGICLGHIVIINGEYIVIGKDGIYELSEEDTNITSLSFVSPYQQGCIDFEVTIQEAEKREKNIKQYSSLSKIGQLWGDFRLFDNISESIYFDIVNRYNFKDSVNGINQNVIRIAGLRVQAEPGTSFYVKEKQDTAYEKHTLNETGLLQFYDENTDIQGLYFIGPKLIEVSAQDKEKYGLHPYEFYDTKEVISLAKIRNPKNNHIYHLSPFERTEEDTLIISEQQLEEIEDIITYLQKPIFRDNRLVVSSSELKENNTKWNLNNQYGKMKGINLLQLYCRIIRIPDNSLTWNTDNKEVKELDSESIGLLYSAFDKYIFYQGSWYPFTDNNEVILPNTEAIIDYYCTILRERY